MGGPAGHEAKVSGQGLFIDNKILDVAYADP